MSQVAISGNASGTGTLTIAAPNTNSNYTLTLPQATTTLVGTDATQTLTNKTIQGGAITSGTAVASTSGTSIDFTGIPSWVKRITVMFDGVSTNGTSNIQIQVGSGSFATANYYGYCMVVEGTSTGTATVNTGILVDSAVTAAYVRFGQVIISLRGNNSWTYTSSMGVFGSSAARLNLGGGSTGTAISNALDRIRITTVNGTDTFDAGSINILYE